VKYIIPIFDQYPLKSCKHHDYIYVLKAIKMLNSDKPPIEKNEHLLNLKNEIRELKRCRYLAAPAVKLDED